VHGSDRVVVWMLCAAERKPADAAPAVVHELDTVLPGQQQSFSLFIFAGAAYTQVTCTASGAGCVFLMSCTVLVHVYQVGWVLCVCCVSCLSELFLDACGLIAAGLVSRPTQWMTSRFQCWRLNLIESCSVSGLFAVVECVVLYAGSTAVGACVGV
jgi:hypothetical protein